MSDDYRTDRKKVEGLGGGRHGAGVWKRERISSMILVVLGIWGLWAATRLMNGVEGSGFDAAADWLRSPVNAVLLVLLLVTALYHMNLGLRVVIEDYVHKPAGKGALLFLNFIVCAVLGVAAVFAVLKVVFGGRLGI